MNITLEPSGILKIRLRTALLTILYYSNVVKINVFVYPVNNTFWEVLRYPKAFDNW